MPNGRTAPSSSPRKAPVSAAAARRSLPLFAPSAERCSGQAGSDDDTEGGALRPAGFHGGAASQMVADRSRTHTVDRFVGFGHRETQENARKFPSPAHPGRFVRIARNERRPAAKSACARRMQSAVRDGIARTVSQDRSRFGEAAETSAIRQSETAPDAHRPAGRDLSKCPESRPAGRPCGQFANFDSASARPCGLRGRGAPARAAGRGRKRMHRNPHRGNAAGKADAAQRHDNAPRNPPNRDRCAGKSCRKGSEKDVPELTPRQCGRESRCCAETRQPTPKPTEPRQRCAAEAVASSGGDPPRRPPPEADAHRPSRRPEENPAAG